MNVVIIGAKERDGEPERLFVEELIEKAAAQYGSCVFVTMITHVGVGRFVKEKCLDKNARGDFRFQLIEWNLRLYATRLSKAETSAIYLARNATLFEIGDVFLYLAAIDRRGTFEELIQQRVHPAGRPYRVYLPGDAAELP